MKTKAAILYETGKPLIIEEVEIPVLKDGQVLVKIAYSGICRSQLHEIEGSKGIDKYLPHMLGHEASGRIVDIGNGVTKVGVDDRVVVSWIKGWGMEVPFTNYGHVNAGAVTTFSEYAVVSENRVVVISKNMLLNVASLLGCAVSTGGGIVLHQCENIGNLAVVGVGGIGLSSVALASIMGFHDIIAIDIDDAKLELARKMGANYTINALEINPLLAIGDLTDGNGVNYVISTVDVMEIIEDSLKIVKWDIHNNGKMIIAGNPPSDEKMSIDFFDLKGKQVVGSWGGLTNPDVDIPYYVNRYMNGVLKLDDMITDVYQLYDINKAFQDMRNGKIVGRAILEL